MDYRELEAAGVRVPELLDRMMNNAALIKMIVGKFLADKTHAQLKEAVAQGDRKAAEFACHSLKGICGNMALTALFAQTQEQLRLFRAGEYDAAEAMMEDISAGYENAALHMQRWLEQQ